MITTRRTAMALLLTGAMAAVNLPALAAIPDMSPATLTAEADLILTGRLVAVTTTRKVPEWVKRRDDISFFERGAFVDEVFTLAIEVGTVEKGSRGLAGKTIATHGWRAHGRPPGWAGPGGTIRDLPAEGTRIKVWLRREQDGWDLISPSGLVPAP
ncbi:hypothetical protein RNI52_24970 [Labrys neptuniae]|uniref:hypothetical protein n=1 Tax=Labrys neptuniae TaxID=376174 RepID=UPI00289010C7|nr:hypothetical protein [Labrys neptuniae]MDT3380601.1 hypothetical protein [Labrys neptuniae]